MSYSEKIILEGETFDRFGYSSKDCRKKDPVVFQCQDCSAIFVRPLKYQHTKHSCPTIREGQKKCSKCRQWKVVELFTKNKGRRDGYGRYCKDCFNSLPAVKRADQKKNYYRKFKNEDYTQFFNFKSSQIKNRVSYKGKGIECNITGEELLEIFLRQNKVCYYTGLAFSTSDEYNWSWNTLSIDRLNPEKGYTKENCVLCLYCINSLKGSLTENEFKEVVNDIFSGLQRNYLNE